MEILNVNPNASRASKLYHTAWPCVVGAGMAVISAKTAMELAVMQQAQNLPALSSDFEKVVVGTGVAFGAVAIGAGISFVKTLRHG